MNFATSAVCALAISFLFYDQRNLHELGRRTTVDVTREGWEKRAGGKPRIYRAYVDPDPVTELSGVLPTYAGQPFD